MVYYYLFPLFSINTTLTEFQFLLLVSGTLLIAVGGNVINDIQDIRTDSINKPDKVWIPKLLKRKQAFLLYYIVNVIGLGVGFYLVFLVNKFELFFYFLLPVLLLYFYAVWAKKQFVIGNILVSLLVAFSLFIVVLFQNTLASVTPFIFSFYELIFVLLFFAFSVNLLREIVKDAEDVIGDRATGSDSIPIRYGFDRTNEILVIISILPVAMLLALALYLFKTQLVLSLYLIFGVLMSFVLFLNQVKKATKSVHYKTISTLLKLVMVVGLLSVFMIFPN